MASNKWKSHTRQLLAI